MVNDLIRVNADDEGFLIDDISLYQGDKMLYQGKPFTGIKYAEYSIGQLHQESYYKDGWPNRMSRSWYPNGQLKEQSNFKKGDQFAVIIEWYPNGMIKSVTHTEWRFQILIQEWDEDGNLINNFRRDENDLILQNQREYHRLTNSQDDSSLS